MGDLWTYKVICPEGLAREMMRYESSRPIAKKLVQKAPSYYEEPLRSLKDVYEWTIAGITPPVTKRWLSFGCEPFDIRKHKKPIDVGAMISPGKVVLGLLLLAGVGMASSLYPKVQGIMDTVRRLRKGHLVIDMSDKFEKDMPVVASLMKSSGVFPKRIPTEPIYKAIMERDPKKKSKLLKKVEEITKYFKVSLEE